MGKTQVQGLFSRLQNFHNSGCLSIAKTDENLAKQLQHILQELYTEKCELDEIPAVILENDTPLPNYHNPYPSPLSYDREFSINGWRAETIEAKSKTKYFAVNNRQISILSKTQIIPQGLR